MASLGELFVKVGADIQGFKTAMGDVNTQLKTLDSEAAKSSAGFQALGTRLTDVGMGMTAAITAPIVGVGLASVVTAGQLQQTEIAFTNFLGSAQAATAMLEELRQFAESTPFEFTGLVNSAQRLMAMGFEAEKVIPMLRTVGDAVAGIGGGEAEINRVVLALGQMQAKGKVSAQEMNQLAELGIPVWQMLADQIGISIPQAMKQAELGAIASAEAIPAILAGMNERFGGMMDQQSKTLLGQWSNMVDKVKGILVQIGQVLIPFAQSAVQAVIPIMSAIKSVAEAFTTLPQPIQTAILIITGLVAAVGPLLLVAGQLVSAWAAVAPLFGAAGLAGVLTTLAPIIAAVVAAFAAWQLGTWAYTNVTPFKEAIDAVWTAITAVVGLVGDVAVAAFTAWWMLVQAIGSFLWDFFKPGIDAVCTVFTALASIVSSVVSAAFQSFLNGIQTISSTVNTFRTALQEWTGTADQTKIKSENVKTAYDQMGEAAKQATQPTKDLDKASGTKGFAGAAADAESATTKWKKELEELKKKALNEAREEAGKFNLTLQATAKAAGEAYDENEKLRLKLVDLKTDLMQGRDATWAMETALNDMKDMLGDVGTETTSLKNLVVPEFAQMSTKVSDYKTDIGDLAGAYTSLGITTKAELEKIVTDTETAKNAILGDEDATEWAKKTAIYKALQAQRNLSLALGTDLPQDQKDLMEKLKTETETGLNGADGIKSKWESFSTSVSTTISNFAQSIGQSLFDGDLSFGEKVKKMLTDLGSAIVTLMIEPWTAAIAKWITDAVDGLLGGAFNKIGGWLGDAASKISGIFNGTSSVPTPSVPVPTNPTIPGGGGGGSTAPASGGGFAGAVGIISGITTAVTGVIGLFQNKGMNAALDVIVKHTLQTVMILETTFYWVTDFLGQIRNGILDSKDRIDWMSTAMSDGLDSIHQRLFELRTFGIQIDLAGALSVPVTVADFSDTALERFTRVMSKAVVIHNTIELDGKVIADGVVEHLEDNGIVLP